MNNQGKYPIRGTYHNPNAEYHIYIYIHRVRFIFVQKKMFMIRYAIHSFLYFRVYCACAHDMKENQILIKKSQLNSIIEWK